MRRCATWLMCVWVVATWGRLDAACADDDPQANTTMACQGARLLWRWLDSPEGLRLSDGVWLARVADDEAAARNLVQDDGSLLAKATRFAASHELRVRLSEVLPAPEDLLAGHSAQGTARGKNKGGGMAMVAAMGMMMKGVLGAVGLGGAALLAMKALMVSMMALMLSAIVGVKKLASSHDDGGTHHVQVVPVHSGGDHHYRKRRSHHPYSAYLAGRK